MAYPNPSPAAMKAAKKIITRAPISVLSFAAIIDAALQPERDRAERMREALQSLVSDVADYPAWERPCHALDAARAALADPRPPQEDLKTDAITGYQHRRGTDPVADYERRQEARNSHPPTK